MAVVLQPLPWDLDLSCPLPKPTKPLAGVAWPFTVAGPSCRPYEPAEAFIKRRYFETLYLPETFSPLSGFTADLQRFSSPGSSSTSISASPSPLPALLKPLMLSLPSIDTRHRKTILPFLSASTTPAALTAPPEGMREAELGVMRMALDLQATSRLALDDGVVLGAKEVADRLEKRETLIQIIFLLFYLNTSPSPTSAPGPSLDPNSFDPEALPKPKKRKRRQAIEPETPAVTSPTEDPAAAIELLLDRVSVWQAVADLGIGLDFGGASAGGAGRSKVEANPVGRMLQHFWDAVLVPSFLRTNPSICSSYHQKVFCKPIPAHLLPQPSTAKKSRKPKLTHAMPSADGDLFPVRWPEALAADRGAKGKQREVEVGYGRDREREKERSMSRPHSRAPSRAPSETSVGTTMDHNPATIRRSISRTESQTQAQSQSQLRRSRSRSTDVMGKPESGLGSCGSGVGVGVGVSVGVGVGGIVGVGESGRGSGSMALAGAIKKSISRAQSGKDLFKGREVGLMRRTASKKADMSAASGSGGGLQGLGGVGRDVAREDKSQGRFGLLGRKLSGGREKDKKIEDTNTIIMATPSKPRYTFNPSYQQWQHPTPIREEPTSGPRPSYVAETPVAPGRTAGNIAYASGEEAEDPGEESDDPLGDLMVMTDDEDEEPPAKRSFVPETPGR